MSNQPPELDKRRVRDSFGRAAGTYDSAASFQRTIADELLSRLDLVKLAPARVLDVGSGTGYCTRALTRRYRDAEIIGLDVAHAALLQARGREGIASWLPFMRRASYVCADAERLPFARDSIDLILSNLTLQWCDPVQVFPEFLRVLRPGGLLMFTTLGPDTLQELRAAWRAVDQHTHVHAFIDMHDLGDSLLQAGFADPVMDVERLTLTYPDVPSLLRDLKRLGAHNAAQGRHHGLTGKARFARFVEAYELQRREGRIPVSYEAVFGHAWVPERKPTSSRRADGSFAFSVDQLQKRR